MTHCGDAAISSMVVPKTTLPAHRLAEGLCELVLHFMWQIVPHIFSDVQISYARQDAPAASPVIRRSVACYH